MLIGGPLLWVVGSIHNSCQIYERGDARLQILQHAVLVPFLIASLLFLLGAIENTSPTFHLMVPTYFFIYSIHDIVLPLITDHCKYS